MQTTPDITVQELTAEELELLPARQALNMIQAASVTATNQALALNAASHLSIAHATALQAVTVAQH